jgi:hypothetical protein
MLTHMHTLSFSLSRAILKVTSGELLTNQTITKKKKSITYINTYTNMLPLEMGKLYHGISFSLPVPKGSSACDLSCFNTVHQLLIVEVLWSQPILQVGTSEQVAVVWSEIRAMRQVVKQLWVKMLQQCSNASSCMRTCIAMEEHFTGCQHSSP